MIEKEKLLWTPYLPPVPSAARIIQPTNEDTALFILQSVLKAGAHLPAGKWMNLVKLLLESPPNPGPCVPYPSKVRYTLATMGAQTPR